MDHPVLLVECRTMDNVEETVNTNQNSYFLLRLFIILLQDLRNQ
jgi:hypothetical protein